MLFQVHVNEVSDQTVITVDSTAPNDMMNADDALLALIEWRMQPGNVHRPVSIVNEQGIVYVDEDRWHCDHIHKREQIAAARGEDERDSQAVAQAIYALTHWYPNASMPYADQTRVARWLREAFPNVEAQPCEPGGPSDNTVPCKWEYAEDHVYFVRQSDMCVLGYCKRIGDVHTSVWQAFVHDEYAGTYFGSSAHAKGAVIRSLKDDERGVAHPVTYTVNGRAV